MIKNSSAFLKTFLIIMYRVKWEITTAPEEFKALPKIILKIFAVKYNSGVTGFTSSIFTSSILPMI